MRVEAEYTKEVISADPQHVQCIIPGPPDAPEIWTRSVSNSEFVIEWGEPRLYGVKLRGYQVFINGKHVGKALSSHHRKAVIPCKPRRLVERHAVTSPLRHVHPLGVCVRFTCSPF